MARLGNNTMHNIADSALKSCFLDMVLNVELAPKNGLSLRLQGDAVHALYFMFDPEKAATLNRLHHQLVTKTQFQHALGNTVNSMINEVKSYVAGYAAFKDATLTGEQYDFVYDVFEYVHDEDHVKLALSEVDEKLLLIVAKAILDTFDAEHAAINKRRLAAIDAMQPVMVTPESIIVPLDMAGEITIEGDTYAPLLEDVKALLGDPYEAYVKAIGDPACPNMLSSLKCLEKARGSLTRDTATALLSALSGSVRVHS